LFNFEKLTNFDYYSTYLDYYSTKSRKSSLPKFLHNVFDNHGLDSIDDPDNFQWLKLGWERALGPDNIEVMPVPCPLLSSLETKSMLLYKYLVAGPITCILPDTALGWPTMCLGVGTAVTKHLQARCFCIGKTRHCEDAANQQRFNWSFPSNPDY
jgi:hypothetical protein